MVFKRMSYKLAITLYVLIATFGFIIPIFILGIPMFFIIDGLLNLFKISLSDDLHYILLIAISYILLAIALLLVTKSQTLNNLTSSASRSFLYICILFSVLTFLSVLYYIYQVNPAIRNQEFGAFKGWGIFFGAWTTGFFSGLATMTGGYARSLRSKVKSS